MDSPRRAAGFGDAEPGREFSVPSKNSLTGQWNLGLYWELDGFCRRGAGRYFRDGKYE